MHVCVALSYVQKVSINAWVPLAPMAPASHVPTDGNTALVPSPKRNLTDNSRSVEHAGCLFCGPSMHVLAAGVGKTLVGVVLTYL